MAEGYKNNIAIKKDVDSWKFTDNEIVKNMYDSIILKVNNEDLQFEEQYPINEFKSISGELKIVGLSPNNDTHIFEIINNNCTLKKVIYYYYDKNECEVVKNLLNELLNKFHLAPNIFLWPFLHQKLPHIFFQLMLQKLLHTFMFHSFPTNIFKLLI